MIEILSKEIYDDFATINQRALHIYEITAILICGSCHFSMCAAAKSKHG